MDAFEYSVAHVFSRGIHELTDVLATLYSMRDMCWIWTYLEQDINIVKILIF